MIESLSYIGFTSPNADAWKTFGPEILGLELAEPGVDGAVQLRLDDAVWRVAIHPGAKNDLAYFGWGVDGPDSLARAGERLAEAGFDAHAGDADLLATRSVRELLWFTDPFGFRHELSWGRTSRPVSFRPGRAIAGFVTGDGGAGHAVLFVPDRDEAERFFTDVLGFRLSDRISMGGVEVSFMHCNPRHHSLAFVGIPNTVGFHHLMLEVASLDDVGTAYDLCRAHGVPITMTLGRHTNDRMTSFYLRSPSGFDVEYGWGGALVDDATWIAGSYDAPSIWGHRRPDGDAPPPPGIMRRLEESARG